MTKELRCNSPPEEVQTRLREHELWLSTAARKGRRLSNNRLNLPPFEGLRLDGVDFSLADLALMSFKNCSLRNACFFRTDLSGSVFVGCDLTNATFKKAEIRLANFVGARYIGADFSGASIDSAVWTEQDKLNSRLNIKSEPEGDRNAAESASFDPSP